MKLLLDEMWSPGIAAELQTHGHDVIAVAAMPQLRAQPDPQVFDAAQSEERAVVTENASDFRHLATTYLREGRQHHGLILTSNRRYPRHDRRTYGRLVAALDALLQEDINLRDSEYWLP